MATHIKAGDISVIRLSSSTYQFTLAVYTDSSSIVDDPTATLDFGDGTTGTVNRQSKISVGNATWRNIYVFTHSFSGAGFFKVGYTEFNRVAGIKNMQQSVNTAFYIESSVTIDPFLGVNDSPILLVPPIDEGSVGQPYFHNPGAYDPNGDSLSYKLVTPKRSASQEVIGYVDPNLVAGTGTLILDPVTGDLTWDAPVIPGIYNIAILVEEWRNDVRIGYVVRDMQIRIRQVINLPPVLEIPDDTCVIAGTSILRLITATDPDLDRVRLFATSGIFLDPPYLANPKAVFNPVNGTLQPVPASATLTWDVGCQHVRQQPYDVLFKAEDERPTSQKLFDLQSWRLSVVGPAITNVSLLVGAQAIDLTWDSYVCSNAVKINIYRSACAPSGFVPGPCTKAVPSSFQFIGQVNGNEVSFTDDNDGAGLNTGVTYCYVLQAVFPQPTGGVSLPSAEVCAGLDLNAPVLNNVSVALTDPSVGRINLHWYAPLNTTLPAPITYEVYRATGLSGGSYSLVGITTDTFYLDQNLDTENQLYHYRIQIVSTAFESSDASVVSLTTVAGNQQVQVAWTAVVPWQIDSIYLYHQVNGGPWELIYQDLASAGQFTDLNLQNCDAVNYKALMTGYYCDIRLNDSIRNWSSVVSDVPKNTEQPIASVLQVNGCAGDLSVYDNELFWNSVDELGCPVIAAYQIYFAPYAGDSFTLLNTTVANSYIDTDSVSLAGCYRVAAVNFLGQEGLYSNTICVDNCVYYELPNLVTPDGDSLNDVLRPLRGLRGVKSVHLFVYNSWGSLVHEQVGDPLLGWNPLRDQPAFTDGVYYFLAQVNYERRLNRSDEYREIRSWLHIVSQKNGYREP